MITLERVGVYVITLSSAFMEQICREGEQAYPNECCGVLYGTLGEDGNKTVAELEAIPNSSESGEQFHRFLITPEIMLDCERKARSRKQDIVGFYHSRPDCAADASEYDRARALPVYSYIITSVINRSAVDTKSWQLEDNGESYIFKQEQIWQQPF